MRREACGEMIRQALGERDLVVCSLGSVNRTWRAVEAPHPTYFCSDPMGIAVATALGLALARPGRRVVLLCGDGELLMSLPALVTVAGSGAKNLKIVVFNNRRYETGGAQPLPAPAASFAGFAAAAGLGWARESAAEDETARLLEALFAFDGAGLLSLEIDPSPLGYGPPAELSQAEERALFMQRLRAAGPG